MVVAPPRKPRRRQRHRTMVVAALMVPSALLPAGPVAAELPRHQVPRLDVLSNRGDLVSGGDTLVDVALTRPTDARSVRITLNGRDVTTAFDIRPNGRFQGLVTGLRDGANQLTATLRRQHGSTLTITNHSKQGPVIAGKQIEPWICETEKFGLGPPAGPGCAAPTRHDFFYKSTVSGRFEPYDPGSPPAAGLVASTTTDRGSTVPFIVRRERGVINRGIYDIAVLFQPGEPWQPWAPQAGWNGKLHWILEGGAGPWHLQAMGSGPANVLDGGVANVTYPTFGLGELALSRGFAVINTPQTRANDMLAAESIMMIKEHLVETYGPVRYTMANGCSGGGQVQHLVANNYPGLLDGIMPICGTPDTWTTSLESIDCELLNRYFTRTAPGLWTDPGQRAAVGGTKDGIPCAMWGTPGSGGEDVLFDPRWGCTSFQPGSEADWVYHPETNPDGVRCTLQDWQIAAFGTRPGDGFANRPWDNVGIQYGLTALRREQITPEQFVDLNARIGGIDIDFTVTGQRSAADPEGLRNLYRSGRLNNAENLDRVPIVDVRGGLNEEIHASVHTQMTRARLIAANGHARNQVVWKSANEFLLPGDGAMMSAAFTLLDDWLAAIEADRGNAPLEVKVARHKPASARDTCWANGQPDACRLPDYATPRLVAGGPPASDIVKCRLKPIDWNDYGPARFSDAQRRQLRATLPNGVCDWTEPGVAQRPPNGPWQSFMTTVGGQPLGPPPRAT